LAKVVELEPTVDWIKTYWYCYQSYRENLYNYCQRDYFPYCKCHPFV